MTLPFMTTEHFPDGDIGLNIFDGDSWERFKFRNWDELEAKKAEIAALVVPSTEQVP